MLVKNLEITYKCYSSIGNSLELKEMISKVLESFVKETSIIFACYYTENKKLASFGTPIKFNQKKYQELQSVINYITINNHIILALKLDYGCIYMFIEDSNKDIKFLTSMLESFINKLNFSIHCCLNVQKMKKLNELLEKEKKELKAASKSKDIFLANMSHELKTPLNSINIISSVMKKNKNGNLDEQQIKNLEIINGCGNYLLSLINDILDISKLESGKASRHYLQIDLYEVLKEVYEMFYPQINHKKLELYFEYDNNIKYIYSDENKIKQIVKNLLSNALKFVEKGSIYLRVKDEDDFINISVEDEGIGIPQNELENIFDRFRQVNSSTTRKYGGTGLGLSICKELVTLLKGAIFVKSEVGIGSTFYVTLPKNLDSLKHLEFIDLKNDPQEKILLEKKKRKKEKKRVLIYNNNAIGFIDIVVKLQKKCKITQIHDKNQLFINSFEDMKKIIVDADTTPIEDINKLSSIYKNKLIVLTQNSKIEIQNIQLINKNEFDKFIKNL
jgi:signal transduction histidine kinase